MDSFRRQRLALRGFSGYRFSRVRRGATAGFAFGFLLKDHALGIAAVPPEAVAYAFAEPLGSSLFRDLVTRRGSAVRRLVRAGSRAGVPFDLRLDEPIAAIRHRSMRRMPSEVFVLAASDFFLATYEPLRSSGFLESVRKATTQPK